RPLAWPHAAAGRGGQVRGLSMLRVRQNGASTGPALGVAALLGGLLALAALAVGCGSQRGRPADPDPVPDIDRPVKARQAEPADVGAVARASNAFVLDLYREVPGDGNRFFSPLSVSTALGMTYAGARGGTAREMARVLHYPFEGERLHLGFAGLLGKLSG